MRLIKVGEERPIDRATFTDTAQDQWRSAKDAFLSAHGKMNSLMDLLHKPGQVKVAGRVTGALYEAKRLRDDVDALIVALDEIVRAAKRVEEADRADRD